MERIMVKDSCTPGTGYPSDCELTEALRTRARERNRPVERSEAWKAALPRAKQIELLLLDVDGVLTDGTLIYLAGGGEAKCFSTQDGLGLRVLQDSGVAVGVITARDSEMVARRCKEMRFAHVYQGQFDKQKAFDEILKQTGLRPLQTAYMGDDWIDLPLLNKVGLALAPSNSAVEIKQRVHYITDRCGGHGAVREACDLILEARGMYGEMFARFDK